MLLPGRWYWVPAQEEQAGQPHSYIIVPLGHISAAYSFGPIWVTGLSTKPQQTQLCSCFQSGGTRRCRLRCQFTQTHTHTHTPHSVKRCGRRGWGSGFKPRDVLTCRQQEGWHGRGSAAGAVPLKTPLGRWCPQAAPRTPGRNCYYCLEGKTAEESI